MATSTSMPARRRRRDLAQPMPQSIAPMLATPGEMPANQRDYTFEYKWDGVRALCYIDRRKLKLESRNRLDITRRYPELHALAYALQDSRVILDGEIVSLDDTGRPGFAKLQRRMHLNDAPQIVRLSRTEPVFYVVFDLLYADGKSLMSEPITHRRKLLEELTLLGPNWQVTPAHLGQGDAMLDAVQRNGLEGLIAKRLDSIYEPGKRSPAWRKIKITQRQEFVVGGWVPERSGLANRVGALLLGYYDCDGQLRYVGKVGTGLSAADHTPLIQQLKRHPVSRSPFADPVPKRSHFIEPNIVVEIEYRRWPEGGMLQHASLQGVRTDKPAREVVKETLT